MACALGLALLAVLWLSGCSQQRQVTISVDGGEKRARTSAQTVREVISEEQIELGPLDRVEPDLWEELRPNMSIAITRVKEETRAERVEIPFDRRTVRNRALPENENRLIQPGQNGVDDLVYRVTLEDGIEVSRKEIQRRSIRQAVAEIMMVGISGQLPSIPITGTVAYVSSGNAWMMRHSSGDRRPLTSSGDLDQRVFALSGDGSHLLYTRGVAEGPPTPLNTLWVITTTVVGETPLPLGVEGAIYADWLPDGKSFVYSTAERISGAPGWKARNDLHIFSTSAMTDTRTLPGPPESVYSWWGSSFAVAPDGRSLAFGSADQIGLINLRTGNNQTLARFPVYHTYSEWVWVPYLSWSPDSQYLVATMHGRGQSPVDEDSPVFDVWALGADGRAQAKLVPLAGMWAMPAWSPETADGSRIAYGQARDPASSQNTLYDLRIMDRDGSNDQPLFPDKSNALRVPQVTWAPDASALLFVKDGDIFLRDLISGRVHALTDDGYSGVPRWSR